MVQFLSIIFWGISSIIVGFFKSSRFLCHPVFVLHVLQNAKESHSAEHATHTGWHKRTGTFEMRSGSKRMQTWRRRPSTGRNFQTLIIWITVSQKASYNGSISVNTFFFWISSIFVGFFKSSRFLCHPVWCSHKTTALIKTAINSLPYSACT